jgi:E3 ubiquitin-protein ligase listerin
VYGLLQICLQNESYTLDWEIVSAAVISKAMHTSQLGSSLDFSETLAILTELHPDVWTDRYSSKAPAAKRLRQFLKKGSQGGPPRCWENISRVLRHVPARILLLEPAEANSTSKMNLQEAEGLTSCLFEGITRKDEPRPNLSAAWGAYVDISLWIVSQIDGQEGIRGFMSTRLSPLLSQYVRPSTSTSSWSINSPQASRICVECLSKIAIVQGAFFEALWTSLSDSLIEDMKLSLPAQSTGYRDSQDAISANANRLFSIQQAVLATGGPDIVRKTYSRTTKATLESAIQLLISRSGKPYGCAAVIDAAVRRVPELAFESPSGTSLIMDFLKTSGPTLVDSPSSDLLVSILLNSKGNRDYEDALTAMVDAFLASASFQRTPGFARILSLADLGALNCFPRIQEYIREQFSKALGQPRPGLETEWNQFGAFLGNPSISFVMAEDMIDSIVEEVLSGENVEETLVGLEVVIRESRPKIKEYVATSKGPTLLSRLILLCESPSEAIAQRATALRASIKSLLAEEGGASLTAKSAIEIIMHNLEVVDDNSLS